MRRRLVLASLLVATVAAAQAPESLEAWRYFKRVGPGTAASASLVLDAEALAAARPDAADLRLYAGDREIPYALRIRRAIHSSDAFRPQEFNRSQRGSIALLTVDLGSSPAEHNAVEIDTAGLNFRRRATVEGSYDGEEWFALAEDKLLFRFAARGADAEERTIKYPPSRFRYLRLSVEADPANESEPPFIRHAIVRRIIRAEAELLPFRAFAVSRQPTQEEKRAASVHRIRFPGRLPLFALELEIPEAPFSRPYQLWIAEPPERAVSVRQGTLRRRQAQPVRIEFDEIWAEELELTVIDDRNAPLEISEATGWSAAREILFEGAEAVSDVRLYYGNPQAVAPRYDIDDAFSTVAALRGDRRPLGPQQLNPDYEPQEPLTERAPWLLYVGLAGAVTTLLLILRSVLRAVGNGTPDPPEDIASELRLGGSTPAHEQQRQRSGAEGDGARFGDRRRIVGGREADVHDVDARSPAGQQNVHEADPRNDS